MPDGFAIRHVDGWFDITDDVEADSPPWTLARPDGGGAFQVSAALYRGGAVPSPSPDDLLTMVQEVLSRPGMSRPTDIVTESGELCLAAASCRWGDDFVRVWYLSDGRSIAKVTYTGAWGSQDVELPDCEQMVRTLSFTDERRTA